MESLIIVALLFLIAETTYLVVTTTSTQKKTVLSPVFVDTSVLIDGRITSIAQSGFLTRPLYIPRSVVGELQLLADGADSEKRSRARHGLDVIKDLQNITSIQTVIFPDGVRADEGVDNRLLALAKKHNGALCTIDYNLNKVADVEGIEVLNINELAKTLRMAYLPGERTRLELTQKGNDPHQAVGHLEDGTMVVVENAHRSIGKTVEVEFVRGLQTAAGKMMFAKLTAASSSVASTKNHTPRQTRQPARVTTKPSGRSSQDSATPSAASAERSAVIKTTKMAAKSPSAAMPKKRYSGRQKHSRASRTPEDSLVELANR